MLRTERLTASAELNGPVGLGVGVANQNEAVFKDEIVLDNAAELIRGQGHAAGGIIILPDFPDNRRLGNYTVNADVQEGRQATDSV